MPKTKLLSKILAEPPAVQQPLKNKRSIFDEIPKSSRSKRAKRSCDFSRLTESFNQQPVIHFQSGSVTPAPTLTPVSKAKNLRSLKNISATVSDQTNIKIIEINDDQWNQIHKILAKKGLAEERKYSKKEFIEIIYSFYMHKKSQSLREIFMKYTGRNIKSNDTLLRSLKGYDNQLKEKELVEPIAQILGINIQNFQEKSTALADARVELQKYLDHPVLKKQPNLSSDEWQQVLRKLAVKKIRLHKKNKHKHLSLLIYILSTAKPHFRDYFGAPNTMLDRHGIRSIMASRLSAYFKYLHANREILKDILQTLVEIRSKVQTAKNQSGVQESESETKTETETDVDADLLMAAGYEDDAIDQTPDLGGIDSAGINFVELDFFDAQKFLENIDMYSE